MRARSAAPPGLIESVGDSSSGRFQRMRAPTYQVLAQVVLVHDFYNLENDICPDFTCQPTRETTQLLASLGMVFRDDGGGFSILYNEARKAALIGYLHGADHDGDSGRWTRTSVMLSSNNPYFVSATMLPIGFNPTHQNFYLSNRTAHRSPTTGEIILNEGRAVGMKQAQPVVGSELRITVGPTVTKVVVRNVGHRQVMPPIDPPPLDEGFENDRLRPVYIEFSHTPYGLYEIRRIEGLDGVEAKGQAKLYTCPAPLPLCFVDLLFTQPPAHKLGVYPIDLQHDQITPTIYQIQFNTRMAFWRYYIVPQTADRSFEGLSIDTVSPTRPKRFTGPTSVTLVNGVVAQCFVSEKPLPLQQRSDFNFQLRGHRRGQPSDDDILVDRLPVAAPSQVSQDADQAPDDPATYCDMYVYV